MAVQGESVPSVQAGSVMGRRGEGSHTGIQIVQVLGHRTISGGGKCREDRGRGCLHVMGVCNSPIYHCV